MQIAHFTVATNFTHKVSVACRQTDNNHVLSDHGTTHTTCSGGHHITSADIAHISSWFMRFGQQSSFLRHLPSNLVLQDLFLPSQSSVFYSPFLTNLLSINQKSILCCPLFHQSSLKDCAFSLHCAFTPIPKLFRVFYTCRVLCSWRPPNSPMKNSHWRLR